MENCHCDLNYNQSIVSYFSFSCSCYLSFKRVSAVNCAGWLESLTEPPLLQSCPAAPFLASYFPDGVGLSPTINNWKQNDATSTGRI